MIATFKRVVKRTPRLYTHAEVDNLLAYLAAPILERGAIAKISQGPGTPAPTTRDWHELRTVDSKWFPLANGILGPER
jgi:hypothetical protein